jgi:hypothetical protein
MDSVVKGPDLNGLMWKTCKENFRQSSKSSETEKTSESLVKLEKQKEDQGN